MARNKYRSNGFGNVWAILNGRAGAIRSGSIPTDVEFTVRQTERGTKADISSVHGNTVVEEGAMINFTGTGIKSEGEGWSETRQLPTATYFPTGMKSAGSVYDELTPNKAITRIGAVDLGSIDWLPGQAAGKPIFFSKALIGTIKEPSGVKEVPNLLCAELTATSYNGIGSRDGMITVIWVDSSYHGWLYVHDERYADEDAFKAAMSGVILYYELATPTETPIDPPLNLSYRVEKGGTETLLPDDGTTSPFVGTIDYLIDYTGIVNALTLLRRLDLRDEDFLTIGLALIESRARAAEEEEDDDDAIPSLAFFAPEEDDEDEGNFLPDAEGPDDDFSIGQIFPEAENVDGPDAPEAMTSEEE